MQERLRTGDRAITIGIYPRMDKSKIVQILNVSEYLKGKAFHLTGMMLLFSPLFSFFFSLFYECLEFES